jgi:hypothetical protein
MFSRLGLGFTLVAFTLLPLANAKAQKRFVTPIDGSWLEVERIIKGRSDTKPDYLCGYKFDSSTWHLWARDGELQPLNDKCRIDTSTKPYRIDLFGTQRTGSPTPKVKVGIFKIEQGRLILATSAQWVEVRKWPKGKDYPNRPRDFKSTKDNDVRVSVMVRCEYLDQELPQNTTEPEKASAPKPKPLPRPKPRPQPTLGEAKPGFWGVVSVAGPIPTPKKHEVGPVMKQHTGKAFYTDETWLVGEEGGLANCVVTLYPLTKVRPAVKPMAQAVLDKVDVRYHPRVLVVTPGTPVLLRNRASPCRGFRIESKSPTLGNEKNLRILEGKDQVIRLQGPDLCTLSCPFRPYTRGYIHVVDTPYFAVTDKEGRFSLTNVPPGRYRIRVWHEANGYAGKGRSRFITVGTEPQEGLLFRIHTTPRQTSEGIVFTLEKPNLVRALCFSGNNRYLYAVIMHSVTQRKELVRWDLRTKERRSLGRLTKGGRVRKLEWDRGKVIVHAETWIGWFDPDTGKLRAELEHRGGGHPGLRYEEWRGERLAASAHWPSKQGYPLTLAGDRVLLMDRPGRRIHIIDFRNGREVGLMQLPGDVHTGILQPLEVSQDRSIAVVSACALDPGAKIPLWSWDLRTGKRLQAMTYTPRNSAITLPNLLALSGDGTYIVTTPCGVCEEIHVLNARTGKTVHVCRTGRYCHGLAKGPMTNEFACYLDDTIEVRHLPTGKRIAQFEGGRESEDPGGFTYSLDGTHLAWGGEQIRVVKISSILKE